MTQTMNTNEKSMKAKSFFKKMLRYEQFGITVAIVLEIVVLSIFAPRFLTVDNILNVLRSVSIIGIAAIGVMMTILLGGMDISMGSMQGVVGIGASLVYVYTGSAVLTLLVALCIGLGIGFLNGLFITKLKIADIIVTIAMMFSLRGLTYLLTSAHPVNWFQKSWLDWIGTGYLGPIPAPVIILAVLFILFNFILNNSSFGRKIYAVGGNKEAAVLSGINADKMRIFVYMISGTTAAISGLVLASRLSSGQPNAGVGFEFQVLAGILLGGVGLSGGYGKLTGTMIGVLFFGILSNGLILMNVSSFWQQFLTGFLILGAVGLDVKTRALNK